MFSLKLVILHVPTQSLFVSYVEASALLTVMRLPNRGEGQVGVIPSMMWGNRSMTIGDRISPNAENNSHVTSFAQLMKQLITVCSHINSKNKTIAVMASNDPDAQTSSTSEPVIHTYHCICTQLILASTTTLDKLPSRASDKSHICRLPAEPNNSSHHASLIGTTLDSKPTVIRLEDGFEKRYFEKCARCEVIVGYHLDKSQFEESKSQLGCKEDVVYLLPGGLMTTDEMKAGKKMDSEIGKIAVKA